MRQDKKVEAKAQPANSSHSPLGLRRPALHRRHRLHGAVDLHPEDPEVRVLVVLAGDERGVERANAGRVGVAVGELERAAELASHAAGAKADLKNQEDLFCKKNNLKNFILK